VLGCERRFLREYHALSEELRCDVNHRLMESLRHREERDWARFGRITLEREKRLRDPNDVLLEADRIRTQRRRRKQQAKPQRKRKPTTPRKQVRA
jgi:hypothetical protein